MQFTSRQPKSLQLPGFHSVRSFRFILYIWLTFSFFGEFHRSWTFNSTANECQTYVYGGCGKTANLFNSQDECNTACGPDPAGKNQSHHFTIYWFVCMLACISKWVHEKLICLSSTAVCTGIDEHALFFCFAWFCSCHFLELAKIEIIDAWSGEFPDVSVPSSMPEWSVQKWLLLSTSTSK